VGELYLATGTKFAFRRLWGAIFVADATATPKDEVDAHFDLWKRGDGGKGFLRTIRGFERTREKRDLYVSTVRDVPYPVQVVWGARDPALRLERQGEEARRAAGLEEIHTLPAKHFLQEEQAPAIADRVRELASR
jgi:pimeloyl-ACP methyl ester carboxylesterase